MQLDNAPIELQHQADQQDAQALEAAQEANQDIAHLHDIPSQAPQLKPSGLKLTSLKEHDRHMHQIISEAKSIQ